MLIYFYIYKNVVLVGAEIAFQFVNGFSMNKFFIGLFVSSYNLVLSTLQSLVAIMLEHRKFREELEMVSKEKYRATLTMQRGSMLKYFWWWIFSGFVHGIVIALISLYCYDLGMESRDGSEEDVVDASVAKSVG